MSDSTPQRNESVFIPLTIYQDTAQELDATLYRHPASGARILDVQCRDHENLLSILFRTPPTDNTGLPHILEHAVLGGSAKYPVKDPFFHMLKMSLATFLNAMTGPDYTIYPCASNVAADFFHLADVYLDAVFHPLLQPAHFRQEGYHFTVDPPGDINGRLVVKGIVYNEMRGAYSSANERMQRAIERGLFPDSLYGHDAGGDPDCIMDLRYEDFVTYHRRFYHPSNALIVHYGNIPPASWMPFLDRRLAGVSPRDAAPLPPPPQPHWSQPRRSEDTYPIDAHETTRQRSYLALSWLAAHHPTPTEQMAMEALFIMLTGHAGAPLRRALIDSGLGTDLTHTYTHAFGRELTFHVGIKGSEPDRRKAFEERVLSTLSGLTKPGAIDEAAIEMALTRLGYEFQEISEGYPLKLAAHIYSSWANDDDPFAWLNGRTILAELRRRIKREPDFFPHRIRTWLLDNPHRLTTILRADPEHNERRETALADRLRRHQEKLGLAGRKRILREAAELETFQQRSESAAAINTLPQLRAGDLPRQPAFIPTTVHPESDSLTLLRQDVPANGLNYLVLSTDLGTFSPDELRLASTMFSHVALQMGAAGQDYAALGQRLTAYTGDMRYELMLTTSRRDPRRLVFRLLLRTKFLDTQIEPALELLRDLLFYPEFHDRTRLTNLLNQMREQHHSHVVENALMYAMPAAARHVGPLNHLMAHVGGLSALRQVDRWHSQFAADSTLLPACLGNLAQTLAGTRAWTVSFTGSDRACDGFHTAWRDWQNLVRKEEDPSRREQDLVPGEDAVACSPVRQGLAAPMDVAFNVMSLPLPHASHPDAALLEIGLHLLSFDYLLDEIRFKGSAYGAGCAYRPDQSVAHLYSYRDPAIERTLDVFRELPAVAKRAPWQQDDIDRGILGVARKNLRPVRPESATRTALARHVRDISDDEYQAYHEQLLAATPEKVKRALREHLDSAFPQAGLCIVSSLDRLQRIDPTRLDAVLEIENVLDA